MLINGVEVEKYVRRATGEKFYIPKVLLADKGRLQWLRKHFKTNRQARAYGEMVLGRLKAWKALEAGRMPCAPTQERGEEEGGGA